jgi:multiple sugar transport system permease protein
MTSTPGMRLLKAAAIAAIVIWSVGPILLGVATSFSTQREVNAVPSHWVPQHPTTAAYRALLGGTTGQNTGGTVTQEGEFLQAMTVSAELAIMSTALVLVVSTMAAYAFARLRFRFGGAVLAVLIGTMVVPIFVIVIGLFQVMANWHLIDTKRGLVLVFLATLTPLATWLLYTQVREMPTEPEEAALIDGCRRWQAFLRVVIPQMTSGIPLLLTQTSNAKPVTVLITEYVGKYTTNYPILAAGGVMALIPPAILALALNKRITGMLAGSS